MKHLEEEPKPKKTRNQKKKYRLCEWRDIVARAEDESTGYILPNKSVLEIAKQMPVTTSKLRRLLKSKHPYVEHNLDTVVTIIRHSIQNAYAFEATAQQLKEAQASTASDTVAVTDRTEDPVKEFFQHQDTEVQIKLKPSNRTSELPRESLTISEHTRDANVGAISTLKGAGATVQVLKKPGGAFGALLGSSASKRKLGLDKKGKEEIKLEQIRSSVTLPFHSFLGSSENSKPVVETPSVAPDQPKHVSDLVSSSTLIPSSPLHVTSHLILPQSFFSDSRYYYTIPLTSAIHRTA